MSHLASLQGKSPPSAQKTNEIPAKKATAQPFDCRIYGTVARVCTSQLAMVAELTALRAWYQHMRLYAAAGDWARKALYAKGEAVVCLNIAERSQQLLDWLTRLETSVIWLEKIASARDSRLVQQKALLAQRRALEAVLHKGQENLLAPPKGLQQAFLRSWDASEAVYTQAVKQLPGRAKTQVVTWLNAVYAQAFPEKLLQAVFLR